MAREDKLLGMQGGDRLYAGYRIDMQTADDIRFDDEGAYRFEGVVKSPAPDHPDHPPKTGSLRKALVVDAAARDEVTAHLDATGIAYTVEAVAPTVAEQEAMEDWGAETGVEGVEALKWADALTDLEAGPLSEGDYERGKHPAKGTAFRLPKGRRKTE